MASLADELGVREGAPYLYFAILVVLNWGVVALVQYVTVGYHPVLAYPLWFVPAIGGLGGLWAARRLVSSYEATRPRLTTLVDDPDELPSTVAPWRLQVVVLGVLVGAMVAWLLQPGVLDQIAAVQGPLGLPRHLAIYLLLRLPVVAEVATVIVTIHVLLPWRLASAGLNLDFSDPARLGGLGQVARLLRRSTQVYFLGLFAVTLYALAPRLFPNQPGVPLTSFASFAVAGAWVAGFGLFTLPAWRLHVEMKRQKDRRCRELRDQLADHGRHPDPLPDFRNVDAGTDELLPYLYLDSALRRVEHTREYPTNAALVRDIVVSSLPTIAMYGVTVGLAMLGI